MDLRIDEKGKYYTQRITKDTLLVLLRTADEIVAGSIHIRPEQRLKDELDANRSPFIALTGVAVYDQSGQTCCYQTDVLFVSISQIVTIAPVESMRNFASYPWLELLLNQHHHRIEEADDEDMP